MVRYVRVSMQQASPEFTLLQLRTAPYPQRISQQRSCLFEFASFFLVKNTIDIQLVRCAVEKVIILKPVDQVPLVPNAANLFSPTQPAGVLVAVAEVVRQASIPNRALASTVAVLSKEAAPVFRFGKSLDRQFGRVSVVGVGDSAGFPVLPHLDLELMALHRAPLVGEGLPAAGRTDVISPVVVPDFDAEAIFLWPWRLKVTCMDADACLDMENGAKQKGNVLKLHFFRWEMRKGVLLLIT